jgi:hypothetical protein
LWRETNWGAKQIVAREINCGGQAVRFSGDSFVIVRAKNFYSGMMIARRFAFGGISKFGGPTTMKKTALLALVFVGVSLPVMAKPHHFYTEGRHSSRHDSHRYGDYRSRHHADYHRADHRSRHHADDHDGYRHDSERRGVGETHSHISCDMVRSFVAQVGLAQAKVMAHAAGMTTSEERRARQCLASGA